MAYTRFAKSPRDGTIDPATGATYVDIAPVADPDQFDPRGRDQIGIPTTQTSSKTYNKPQQAEDLSNPTPTAILKYPEDQNYLAYILFRLKKINPWDLDLDTAASILDTSAITEEKAALKALLGSIGESQFDDNADTEEGGFFASNASFQEKSQRESERKRTAAVSKKDILGISHQYVTDAPAVKLYLPQAINVNDVVNYNQSANLGPGAAAGVGALNAGQGFLDAAKAFAGDALGFIGEALSASNTRSELSRLALTRAVQATPTGQQINNAAALGFQVSINPNTRTLFEGVVAREFNFQFDFYPVSQIEAQTVQAIIKHFRTELYPSTIGRGEAGVPIGYNFPHVFEIKFRVGDASAPMPQPHLCYLRNVQTTYNPGSMSFFPDGQPTHTQMTLNFVEFRTLSREDIEEGR